MKATKIIGLLLVLTALGADCPGTAGPGGLGLPLTADGLWILEWSSGGETCITIQNGELVAFVGGCNLPFEVTLSFEAALDQDQFILNAVVLSPLMTNHMGVEFVGTYQADGAYHGVITIEVGRLAQSESGILRPA